jgi:predicted lipid-binding transport protein (Tim44 family)
MSRYVLIRRLRGPAILLLIGVLALLDQAGAIPYFWRFFWPLLLILVGVLLLAERAALAAEGYQPYPGAANPSAGAGAAQSAEPADTAAAPSQPHDFGNGSNGGQS